MSTSRAALVAAIVLIASLCGCREAYNLVEAPALRKHIRELSARHGAPLHEMTCRMTGTTRNGSCIGRASQTDVQRLVHGLELRETKVTSLSGVFPEPQAYCLEFRQRLLNHPVRRFQSERRARSLRLPNGQAFEYLVLDYEPGSGEICIETSYSYG